jgi:excisionase family DNA binding protein
MPVAPGRLLTVAEVAILLRVCKATVYKLCAIGKLAHVRVGNVVRVPPHALADFLGRA